ncbi:MAG: pyruvate, phosphate dikinase, partial [Candidatus Bathyarchaeia archaeon]
MWIYHFENASASLRNLVGGKGADLGEMIKLGLPVPPGFTITTEACKAYLAANRQFPPGLEEAIMEHVRTLEVKTGKRFGESANPLLLSVRSGAPVSMPGMMDTILNVGLNENATIGLANLTGDDAFAFDCYRRLIETMGSVVMGLNRKKFESGSIQRGSHTVGHRNSEKLKQTTISFKAVIKDETGRDFPEDPHKQLILAIKTVFDSWNGPRAVEYRRYYNIQDDMGTAVNIQTMVFGNLDSESGTGVVFTRNPSTGENKLYGEYLQYAQGEDLVAGIRTPKHIGELAKEKPALHQDLLRMAKILESHFEEMQDFEFTVEKGKLWMLQTRTGKRTAQAAVKIAVDMVNEGMISVKDALLRIESSQVEQLLHKQLDPNARLDVAATGLPASPGAASGKVIFDVNETANRGNSGEKIILVRPETAPEDIHGMVASEGILTSRGGMTCHAAVVARGMGKPAVVGCGEIGIDLKSKTFTTASLTIKEGETITIDGSTGSVIIGEVPTVEPELTHEFRQLLQWADESRDLKIRTNADTPESAARARAFGAEGIGLCRTERMFNAKDRLPLVQAMILAHDEQERKEALSKLLPLQKADFKEIFRTMRDLPVNVRLLDLPLHEFLPRIEDLLIDVTKLRLTGSNADTLRHKEMVLQRAQSLSEHNPMLGHRGCRLSITFPEIYEMQTEAIFQAASELAKENLKFGLEIMIPLVGHEKELKSLRSIVEQTAHRVMTQLGFK